MSLKELRQNELVRKAIHLSSASIPILYWFYLDRNLMIKGVSLIALGFLLAEYLRFHVPTGSSLFKMIFGPALRNHEHENLTGATYVFVGAVVNIFLFPKEIAVPALLVLSISDTFAALIGIPFGKHPFLKKSLEGSLAFFVVTLAILLTFFSGYPLIALVVIAAIVTVSEAYPMGLDDNFTIPTITSLLLLLMTMG
jgi:dolichol kinase